MGNMERGRRARRIWAAVVVGLSVGIATGGRVEASFIKAAVPQQAVYYSTSGTVGVPGGGPVGFIDYEGVGAPLPSPAPGGVFYTPGVFSLGGFRVGGLPAGESRTFNALPFSITLDLFDDPFVGSIVSRIRIDGVLDGELSNAVGSGLLASIRSIGYAQPPLGTPPFRLEDLQILAPQYILPAGPLPSRTSPLYAYVNASVPEPTALATLGLGVGALAWRAVRRRRVAKGRATA